MRQDRNAVGLRAALRPVLLGLAAGACSGSGAGGCSPRPPAPEPFAEPPGAPQVPEARELLEIRILDLNAQLEAASGNAGEFAEAAQRRKRILEAARRLSAEGTDPDLRRALGIEELLLRVEREHREFLERRVPEETFARLQASLLAKALAPEGADGLSAFEEARRYAARNAMQDAMTSMVRAFESEEDSAEFDRLLALDTETRTEADVEGLKRIASARRATAASLDEARSSSKAREVRTTSYGPGTAFLVSGSGAPTGSPGNPGDWWESAPAGERVQWLLSWLAEKGGAYEVLRVRDEPCGDCGGSAPSPCRGCGGCGFVRHVRWK